MGIVRDYLVAVGAVSETNVEVFSNKTRDADIPVFRDAVSGVVFIDDYYVGDNEYSDRRRDLSMQGFDDARDTERRIQRLSGLIHGKRILDFGFGAGSFLLKAKELAALVAGIEIESKAVDFLQSKEIPAFESFSGLTNFLSGQELDTVFSFHVLEHLPHPGFFLSESKKLLDPKGGLLVIEVPHARDFLLSDLGFPGFRDFSLWSQHLVLHTRESLERVLSYEGFEVISVESVQRFGLSNHLGWFAEAGPGGHRKAPYDAFNEIVLKSAYDSALASIDRSDTLLAFARPK